MTTVHQHRTPVERAEPREGVHDRIDSVLTKRKMRPNWWPSIRGLARELPLCPTPIPEALANLEPTGLVTSEALRGHRVAWPPTTEPFDHLDQLMDGRVLVEIG